MKDAIVGIVLTAALIVVFSAYAPILPTQSVDGVYPTQSGEGGIVLPGDGSSFSELRPAISEHRTERRTEQGQSETENDAHHKQMEQREEKEQSMNEIIIAFWHGVAAVLIGESCALALGLILSAAWQRRK